MVLVEDLSVWRKEADEIRCIPLLLARVEELSMNGCKPRLRSMQKEKSGAGGI
jgi:hypothetical protein